MSLLWMDGFDHYGSGAAGQLAMLDGVYAAMGIGVQPTSTGFGPRTGSFALQMPPNGFRRILGAAYQTVGCGYALYKKSLPGNNNGTTLFSFNSYENYAQVRVILQSTGALQVDRVSSTSASDTGNGPGLGTILGTSSDGVIVAGAYQHIECRAHIHDTTGSIEIRVNGVTVLNIVGVNTKNPNASPECSQIQIARSVGTTSSGWTTDDRLDDLFLWNDAGTQNNDFLGDRRVRTIFPNGDTAISDWDLVGAASGYDCINDPAPDDETTYISALPLVGSPPTALVSEFELEDPPAGIGAIAAVQTYVRMRKTEAGVTNVQVSMLSNGDASDGIDRPITEVYTYWMDVHELNPNTGTPWSETSLSDAQLRIKRTA